MVRIKNMKDLSEFIPDLCVFQMQLKQATESTKHIKHNHCCKQELPVNSTSMFKTLNIDSLT